MKFKDACFIVTQHALPQHFLSRVMHFFTRIRISWWKNLQIQGVIKIYGVDLSEAVESNPKTYLSFNQFFTRALKQTARPIANDPRAIVSPADGAVSQLGLIDDSAIFQAKGKTFSVVDLLGGDPDRAQPFIGGNFTTIYLSPKDYHRLHMPLDGKLREMIHIPGRLFSVSPTTTENILNLFARNERVVALFETEVGPMALVLVGAIFVSSIETVWHGVVTPPSAKNVQNWDYRDQGIVLKKGEEMGRFNMGSTIIVLFPKDRMNWSEELRANSSVLMGQLLGLTNQQN